MMIHYIGEIYDFNPQPKREDEMIIDIPFFEQYPVKKEVVNGMKEEDLKQTTKDSSEYKELLKIPLEERELFQKNGVLIDGQKRILDIISNLDKIHTISRKNYNQEYKISDLVNWTNTPSYDQLQFILELCWDNLTKEGETTSPMTKPRLVTMTFNFSINKNIL